MQTMAADSGPSDQQYSLRWNDFHSAILSSFRHLRDEEDFVDVTLACDGCSFSAHKVVLSACSPYFRKLLKANPCQHPIVILRDIQKTDMESLLRFMYNGEVHIGQEQLSDFLKAAQLLQVRGLADVPTPGVPISTLEQKISPALYFMEKLPERRASSHMEAKFVDGTSTCWPEGPPSRSEVSRERRSRKGDYNNAHENPATATTPPPHKRARSSDLYKQMKTRTVQIMTQDRSPDRIGNNGHDLRDSLLSAALEGVQNTHSSTNMSGDESSSEAGMSDGEGEVEAEGEGELSRGVTKQEPADYSEDGHTGHAGHPAHGTHNGAMLDHARANNFPGALLNLHGLLPGPSGMHGTSESNFGMSRRSLDMLRVRATDPRPCPKCGKIYRSAHTLRTHLEDKHTICPGYRCVLCGTVAKSRNSLHSHMSRQHRGISTKDLPVLPMPSKFDPELASRLLAKAGVKISPAELRARASPTGPRRSDMKLEVKNGQSAPSETSSIYGDNDDELTITPSTPRYGDPRGLSPPPNINNLANTTITKVPALRAATAKSVESPTMAHNLSAQHDDYQPALGGSAILDTYLQLMAENAFAVGITPEQRAAAMHAAKLAHISAFNTHLGKPYEELSPPPHLNVATYMHHLPRHYDEPLDLGKERDTHPMDKHLQISITDKERDYRLSNSEDNELSYSKKDSSFGMAHNGLTENEQSGHEDNYTDEEMHKEESS